MKKTTRKEYLKNYADYISGLLGALDYNAIDKVIACFLSARERGSTIFFAGNGGSAATASHFAQDLGEVGRKAGVKPFRTISLSTGTPFITALANDYGYENIFTGQLYNLFRKRDILVAISASGNSPNAVKAVKWANKKGGISIGLLGFDGGRLAKLCRYAIHAVTPKGKYGPVEDMHLIIDHMITSHLASSGPQRNIKRRK